MQQPNEIGSFKANDDEEIKIEPQEKADSIDKDFERLENSSEEHSAEGQMEFEKMEGKPTPDHSEVTKNKLEPLRIPSEDRINLISFSSPDFIENPSEFASGQKLNKDPETDANFLKNESVRTETYGEDFSNITFSKLTEEGEQEKKIQTADDEDDNYPRKNLAKNSLNVEKQLNISNTSNGLEKLSNVEAKLSNLFSLSENNILFLASEMSATGQAPRNLSDIENDMSAELGNRESRSPKRVRISEIEEIKELDDNFNKVNSETDIPMLTISPIPVFDVHNRLKRKSEDLVISETEFHRNPEDASLTEEQRRDVKLLQNETKESMLMNESSLEKIKREAPEDSVSEAVSSIIEDMNVNKGNDSLLQNQSAQSDETIFHSVVSQPITSEPSDVSKISKNYVKELTQTLLEEELRTKNEMNQQESTHLNTNPSISNGSQPLISECEGDLSNMRLEFRASNPALVIDITKPTILAEKPIIPAIYQLLPNYSNYQESDTSSTSNRVFDIETSMPDTPQTSAKPSMVAAIVFPNLMLKHNNSHPPLRPDTVPSRAPVTISIKTCPVHYFLDMCDPAAICSKFNTKTVDHAISETLNPCASSSDGEEMKFERQEREQSIHLVDSEMLEVESATRIQKLFRGGLARMIYKLEKINKMNETIFKKCMEKFAAAQCQPQVTGRSPASSSHQIKKTK
jgi:hypothetical protein